MEEPPKELGPRAPIVCLNRPRIAYTSSQQLNMSIGCPRETRIIHDSLFKQDPNHSHYRLQQFIQIYIPE